MSKIKNGSTVKVHYTGKLENEQVFDSSVGREPMEFTVGNGLLIPGFENAIIGLSEGEKTTTKIEPKDAYGNVNKELLHEVDKKMVPEGIQAGQTLQAMTKDGQSQPVIVAEVKESTVVIDANHPLAGKNIIFDIEIVSVA